jgi:hypothetical protein
MPGGRGGQQGHGKGGGGPDDGRRVAEDIVVEAGLEAPARDPARDAEAEDQRAGTGDGDSPPREQRPVYQVCDGHP